MSGEQRGRVGLCSWGKKEAPGGEVLWKWGESGGGGGKKGGSLPDCSFPLFIRPGRPSIHPLHLQDDKLTHRGDKQESAADLRN